jgi:hypothetical protein
VVKRYDFNGYDVCKDEEVDGDYVSYEDYEKLEGNLNYYIGASERCLIKLGEIKVKLEQLREIVWGEDIPSSTIPEYKEHHESIQKILKAIDLMLE